MQQVVVERFGGPEVLVAREAPDPVAGPGEVVVGVRVADTLWVETMVRRGDGRGFWPQTPPYVPGNAVAGQVVSVGDGVDPGWVGRAVVARTGGTGGYAERVAVPATELVPVPDDVDLQVAAALLHDGVTALALLEVTRITAGDRVLVVGASGGLGIASVQLAKARGATVVATARDERKIARVRELGPDAVIDSEAPDWVEQARAALGGTGATVVLDNIGGAVGEAAFALVSPSGRFSAHGTPSGGFAEADPAEAQRRGVTLTGIGEVQLSDEDVRRLTARALAEAAAGRIVPVVGQTHPLAEAADAHAGIEARTVFGKTLLTVEP
ncbi:zinc-binding dehydrogenase [Pseudonocardia kunmingensis]|uniref:NADPH2:quinone reductase n=1 Tax=Pseudonocardia kunmingensis TaxID=630975 RepID=A0A543E2Q2_9PSEU|nr:zinc-binding dehydrogenase [Pseudonocardia kunmingensis]TQM15880.1 NADPH2:quinone reductase [Pseudonocardia kunmingensis]